MCGITGFIHFSCHNLEEASFRIRKMADSIAHRGPDEEGFYVDEHAALGHKRLSIIDLSSGQQPMTTIDQRYHIVFNGEVYNFITIRAELENKGYRFQTSSDTEVVLNAYAEWGDECAKRFNGMFALVIWDRVEKKIFAARDRVGKKPLYYTWDGSRFAFASELKGVLAGGFSKKDLNIRGLDCYFCMGYIPAPLSIYDDVQKLQPAHTLTITQKGLIKKKYWEPDFSRPRYVSMNQAAEQLEEILMDAVKIRLISEVPLGAFLSGGIDSTLVVSFMSKLLDSPVLTNTIGFDDAEYNELAAAKTVAAHLKTDHREFVVAPDARQTILSIAGYLDEPFADSSVIPTWHVCRMARKNVTVVLSGDGGDEAFGGYTFRYIPHLMESKIRSVIPTIVRSSLLAGIGTLYPASSRLPKFLRLKTIFENLSTHAAQAFYRDLVWLREDARRQLYSREFLSGLKGFTPEETVIPLYLASNAEDPVAKSQHTDIQCYMTDDVLVKVDRMSMAHSLEVRNPLLDYRVLEFAAKLPLNLKMDHHTGKLILRHMSASRLPKSILDLPKKGFSIPAAEWLRKDLNSFAHDHIFSSKILATYLNPLSLKKIWDQHQTKNRDHSVLIWGLMMLGLWEKEFHR